MSIQQSVAINRENLPTTSAIVTKAKELGFEIELGRVDLSSYADEISGKLNGVDASFGWGLAPAVEYEDFPIEIPWGDRDVVAEIQTWSSEAGNQLAMIVAASIMMLADGVYFDDYDNVEESPERILAEVRAWIENPED